MFGILRKITFLFFLLSFCSIKGHWIYTLSHTSLRETYFLKFELIVIREFVKIPIIFIYEIMEEKGKLVIRENDVAALQQQYQSLEYR